MRLWSKSGEWGASDGVHDLYIFRSYTTSHPIEIASEIERKKIINLDGAKANIIRLQIANEKK